MNKLILFGLLLLIIGIIYMIYIYENLDQPTTKDQLISLINNSNSNDLVKNISKNMYGSTMHHHYHILYDIRTLLGPEKKIYTEIIVRTMP